MTPINATDFAADTGDGWFFGISPKSAENGLLKLSEMVRDGEALVREVRIEEVADQGDFVTKTLTIKLTEKKV